MPPTIGNFLPPLLRRHPEGFELGHQVWAGPRGHVQGLSPMKASATDVDGSFEDLLRQRYP
jgi:hypothetical protein